ncbi:hypothetical protein ACQP2K_35130 [Microbispora siamensis]
MQQLDQAPGAALPATVVKHLAARNVEAAQLQASVRLSEAFLKGQSQAAGRISEALKALPEMKSLAAMSGVAEAAKMAARNVETAQLQASVRQLQAVARISEALKALPEMKSLAAMSGVAEAAKMAARNVETAQLQASVRLSEAFLKGQLQAAGRISEALKALPDVALLGNAAVEFMTIPSVYEALRQVSTLEAVALPREEFSSDAEFAEMVRYVGLTDVRELLVWMCVLYLIALGINLYHYYPDVTEKFLNYISILQLSLLAPKVCKAISKRSNPSGCGRE